MGTSQAAKAERHDRILREAGRIARAEGLDAVGVARVMSAAGLTHGGFYAHFADRDDLIDQAIGRAFADATAAFEALFAGQESSGMDAFIDTYLSPLHVATPGHGCAVAAFAGDVGRSSDERRAAFRAHYETYVDDLVAICGGRIDRDQAAAALSSVVGAVVIARALGPGTEAAAGVLAGTRRLLAGDPPGGESRR